MLRPAGARLSPELCSELPDLSAPDWNVADVRLLRRASPPLGPYDTHARIAAHVVRVHPRVMRQRGARRETLLHVAHRGLDQRVRRGATHSQAASGEEQTGDRLRCFERWSGRVKGSAAERGEAGEDSAGASDAGIESSCSRESEGKAAGDD